MADLLSTITCPACGFAREERMPTDACRFFYECTGCGALLRPRPGDCCVFCSYGSIPCPPIQQAREQESVACCADDRAEGAVAPPTSSTPPAP